MPGPLVIVAFVYVSRSGSVAVSGALGGIVSTLCSS